MFFLIIGLCGYPVNQVQAVGELFTTPTSICSITRDLKLNMIGSDVKELQKYLNNNGFSLAQAGVGSKGKETTFFGSATRNALIKFQKANEISATIGVFDLATRDFLGCAKPTVISPIVAAPAAAIFQFTRDLKLNMIGNDVKELQKYLNNNGFSLAKTGVGSKGKETTFFGSATRNALVKFQKANKITPAVGFFGSITKKIINKKVIEPTVKADPVTGSNTNTNSQTNNSSSAPTPPAIQNDNQPNNVSQSGYYSISGSITGIVGAVVLQNNGKDDLTIDIGQNSNFTFFTAIADGASYSVTVKPKYLSQTCYINNNIGVVGGANIESIKIACGANLSYNPFTFVFSGGVTSYSLTYTAGSDGTISGAASQTVNSGSSGSAVTAVPDTGYSFVSWSDGVLTAERADSSVTANKSVSATFVINTYTVTFDTNGGDGGSTATQTLDYNTPTVLTTNGFTKTGYSFAGWATASGGAAAYANGANYTIGAADVTLYAKWTAASQTLTFESNGGSSVTALIQDYGTSISAPSAPTKSGYTFANWYNEVGLSTIHTFDTMGLTATVYAKWTAASQTLTFESNGGSSVTAITQDFGSAVSAPSAPTKSGYTFANWYNEVGLSTIHTFDTMGLSTTVYAKWTINTFALTSSAGANGSITPSETVNYGTDKTFTITPNLNYHVADVLVDSVSVGAVASYPFTNVTAAHTISASFTIDTFTLTYSANANGSITGTSLQTVNYSANGTEVTATPNANYHWASWSDAVGTAARTDTNITADKTVSATFALDTHTVTFNKNGGGTEASPTTRVADYNTTVTLPTAPTKAGSAFASWNTQADGNGTAFTASTAVTDNITVYAKWTALTIGMAYQGGKIAYLDGTGHGIIAATADQSAGIIWAISAKQSTSAGTLTAIGTGSANTDKIITQNGAGITYAAGLARAYAGGGYNDWYLPSKDELAQLYLNQAAIGGFTSDNYWSSSESSATNSWRQDFYPGGIQLTDSKGGLHYVRAVRAF